MSVSKHPISLFLSTFLFSFEKPYLPISQPGASVGIVFTTSSWVWAIHPPQRLNPVNCSYSLLLLLSPTTVICSGADIHLIWDQYERINSGLALSFSEWCGIKVWGLGPLQPFCHRGKAGTSGLTSWRPKRKPIRKQRGEGENLESSFGAAGSSLTWSKN